ncbi:MAG: hypothetical protein ACW96M_05760 [Candidatus Thorarchaeota archaeon]|jgi:hypothetical protein
MKIRLLRLIGKGLIIIGIPLLLLMSYGLYFAFTYSGEYGPLPPSYYSDIAALPVFILLDIGMIIIGMILLKRYQEERLLFIKDGEPIHSGKPWNQGSESGLYMTSCGLVLSINQESRATAHVGYKIVPANRATHKECVQNEGRAILDSVVKRGGH